MESWEDFTGHVKSAGRQFTIGIPGPHTVAAVIFRSALDHEGISYTENARDKSAPENDGADGVEHS
jgi:NitT/TauT family transport system substrate-binding protein